MTRAVAVFLALVGAISACTPKAGEKTDPVVRAMLDRAGPGSPFADASSASAPAIVHRPSGMICNLPRNGAFDFGTFPPEAVNEGAYCSTADDGVVLTVMAIRFAKPAALDQVFADALASGAGKATPRRWQGAPTADDTEGGNVRIARLEGVVNGEPAYLRIAVAEAHGWYLQQFATAPAEKAGDAETHAGQQWKRSLSAFSAARASPGPARRE